MNTTEVKQNFQLSLDTIDNEKLLIINSITNTLKDEGVDKIILFGSYAYGKPTQDSDLDIIVVTKDDYLPVTHREKMDLHHKYNSKIRQFRAIIPIDLLAYTKQMYQKFLESGSIFTAEIKFKGKIVYEAITV
jgi:predicted nucleotidyltransferase